MTRAIVVKRVGAPVVLVAGSALLSSMTAQAKRSRDTAQSAASAAELSAAFAEAFAGPVYANQAAGEAATTEGQIFRVSNGDGPPETLTAYRRTSGGSVELDPLATTAALGLPSGGSLIGLELGGYANDAIKFITSSMAGIPDDGNEAADVTTELTALAAAAGAAGLEVRLAARTFKTNDTITFTSSVTGAGAATIISCTATDERPAVKMTGKGVLRDFDIDGNVSADPAEWDEDNYDSFTGSSGLLIDGGGVTVINVNARNVVRAGHKTQEGTENVLYINCSTERARGNFGDGFIAIASRNITRIGCTAKDITRIGFVEDAYGESEGTFCAYILNENCHVENAHDGSIAWISDESGGQYNGGFWAEKSGNVSYKLCSAKNAGDRGFTTVTGADIDGHGFAKFDLELCSVDGTTTGYVAHGLADIPIHVSFEKCAVKTAGITGFSFTNGTSKDVIRIADGSAELSGSAISRSSVKASVGSLTIEGFTEKWSTVNATYRDATDNYYGSVSHFDDAAGEVEIRNWKTFDNSGVLVGSVFKFLSGASATLDLSIEGGYVRGVHIECLRFTADDVTFQQMGNILPAERITVRGGAVMDGNTSSLVVIRSTTEDILFDGVMLDFAASGGYLYFFNQGSSDPYPKMHLRGCRLRKNFETATVKYGIRVNGDGSVINDVDANHIVFSDGVIINTGGATANAVFQLDSSDDLASKVHGRGNLKSSTISNIANGSKVAAAASFENWGS